MEHGTSRALFPFDQGHFPRMLRVFLYSFQNLGGTCPRPPPPERYDPEICGRLISILIETFQSNVYGVPNRPKTLEEGDRGSLWYRYQLIRYQVPSELKVLVPSILGEGAIDLVQLIMNMTNSERRSTSVPRETNGQDQTTPEHVTVASVSLSALSKAKNLF